ncbi:hypothetical protein, partial [Brevibacterium sp. RIT 803]|uniref:hypothetical protein n=1 Tax=Brevibacterium sp. RIT 803 TaxID=2810210 RepID=UPI00194DCADA
MLNLTFDVPVKRLSWLIGLGGGQPCRPQPAKALPLPRVQAIWIDQGTADIDEPHLPGDHGSVTVGLQYEDGNPAKFNSPDSRLHATLTP